MLLLIVECVMGCFFFFDFGHVMKWSEGVMMIGFLVVKRLAFYQESYSFVSIVILYWSIFSWE